MKSDPKYSRVAYKAALPGHARECLAEYLREGFWGTLGRHGIADIVAQGRQKQISPGTTQISCSSEACKDTTASVDMGNG